jgi:hypothetical protein
LGVLNIETTPTKNMSPCAKGLFGFLVILMLASVILGYEGIVRLHRTHYPPFPEVGMMFTVGYTINPPSDEVVLFLDSTAGRILVWFLAVDIPLVCGVMAFRYQWRVLGVGLLIGCAALFCWIGVRIWLHAVLDALPMDN